MKQLLRAIRLDYRRYKATGARSGLGVVLFTQGFWATSNYRVFHYLRRHVRLPVLRTIVRILSVCSNTWMEIVTGISLLPDTEIGEGLYIGHFGPIIINSETRIGRNCNLSQGVTIGMAGRGEKRGCPMIGDRVYIGPNAILIGAITVGDDAAIGAGAVVTKSVPPRAVVVGNPAQIISYEGSFDFVCYDGMDVDPDRLKMKSMKVNEVNE